MGKANTLAFVLMVDSSSSMKTVMDIVKIDAKAFVRQARPNDWYAVNSFASNASWIYPAENSSKMISVSGDLHETKDSLPYIDNLHANGLTNMGAAIQLGNKIMNDTNPSTDLKAYVMLSDGYYNEGADPLTVLGSEPPLFVAALGSVSTSKFEKLLKKNSKSQIYYQPNAYQMMLMFNNIVSDANENGLILNDCDGYQAGADYILKTFSVSSEDNSAQLNVVWSDKKYEYTPNQPDGNGINIVLIDPDDNNTDIKPDIAEDGYCIYNLENVKPGDWKVLIQYSIPDAITGTVGCVDFYTDIKTNMVLPTSIKAGEKLDIKVTPMFENNVIENAKVSARIATPAMSTDYIMDRYSKEIDSIKNENESEEAMDTSVAINILRSNLQKAGHADIFKQNIRTERLSLSKDGEFVFGDTSNVNNGMCNVDIKVEGINPKTGLPFTRLKSGSVFVK